MKEIKDNVHIFSEFIFHNSNNSTFDANFPSELKNADMIPKKKERLEQSNFLIAKIATHSFDYQPFRIIYHES